MYCMHCGRELPDTAQFCDRCGKSTGQGKSTYSYSFKKAKPAAAKTDIHIPDPGEKPQNVATHTAMQKKSDNVGCLGWILIVAAVICLYIWVIKPANQKKHDAGSSHSSAVVQEETKSPEELELERQAARLPGVPEAYYDLPIFKNRLYGNCTTLEGDVAITVLFMDDRESYWTQEDKDAFLSAVYDTCWDLTYEAADWGKEVNFTVQSTQGYVDEDVYPELAYLGFTNHMNSAGFTGNILDLAETLQAQTYTEKVPVIVAFNKWGRSFASALTSESTQVERCYIFDDTSALKHELLHLFGATDFYYHDTVEQAADRYLGDSIMASADAFAPVDDMTAYLIGWTDTLTDNAGTFMYAAGAVGTDAMQEASQENAKNGYFVNTTLSGGRVYTGALAMGSPNGTGEMFWPNGNHYYGEWDHGLMTSGTFTWANGDVFSGEWNNGEMVYGTFTWADGSTFTGEWENGERVYGTFTWPNGTVYEGQFLNGEMHGQGTVTYYNGQVQSGYWENGQFIG